jgi:CheY-like chemotaxis protein
VKNTLTVLDGSIELQSEAGKGSRFKVHIPVKLSAQVQGGGGAVTSETLRNLRFLVVDDHPINRKVVTTILKHWKAFFEVATNGLEAVEKSEKADFDIILMDIQMPVMDGYTAARKIRELKGDKTFILALTASILKEDEQHCLDSGMNGIIRKPFFPDNLRYWIKNLNVQNVPIMDINSTSRDSEFGHEKESERAGSAKGNGSTSSGTPGSTKVTDLGYLQDISDGNEEFMHEMINLFIDQSGDHTGNIQEGIKNADYDKIAGAAHKMKPVLGYVGVAPEASMIRDIEMRAKAHDPLQEIQQLLDTLNNIVHQANEELKAYLKES